MFSRLATTSLSLARQSGISRKRFLLPTTSNISNKKFTEFVANFHAGVPTRNSEEAAVAVKAEEEPSLYDTLSEPMIAGPLIGLLSLGAIGNGIYHFDEETQLLGLFALFVGTVYTQAGDHIGKFLESGCEQMLTDVNQHEDLIIDNLALTVEKLEQFVSMHEDLKQVLQFKKTLVAGHLEAQTQKLKLDAHNQFESLLKSAALQEDNQRQKLKTQLVNDATAAVTKSAKDTKIRQATLAEALKVLGGGEVANDVIGELYVKEFDKATTELETNAAAPSGATPLDKAAFFAQMAALAENEDILGKGKNEHPLIGSLQALNRTFKNEPQTKGEVSALLTTSFASTEEE